ncbi:hypothetical protein HYV89_03185 [Candidatus Woesearchaeota archaeon]|nr:hypothetical protein [Candidatus Woesearchaeota archaeon]
MNKKGEEESSGIGTVTSIVLIIAVLIALVLFIPGTAFTQVKKSLVNVIGEKGELGRLYDEVVNREKLDEKIEQDAAEEIHAFLVEKFNSVKDENDCVTELEFSRFKDKNFEVEFGGRENKATLIRAVSGKRENYKRVYPNIYNYPVCFLNKVKKNNFWIVDGFSKIYDDKENDIVLSAVNSKPILYKNNGEICFVGEGSLPEINIYKKNNCELNARISELEKVGPGDENFISKKIQLVELYFKDKKFMKVLDYYIFLDKYAYLNLDNVQRDRIGSYRELAINELEDGSGKWVLCKIDNRHVCTISKTLCGDTDMDDLAFPKLPAEFMFLRDCENERFKRVSDAEAAIYLAQK